MFRLIRLPQIRLNMLIRFITTEMQEPPLDIPKGLMTPKDTPASASLPRPTGVAKAERSHPMQVPSTQMHNQCRSLLSFMAYFLAWNLSFEFGIALMLSHFFPFNIAPFFTVSFRGQRRTVAVVSQFGLTSCC